ncbi:hemolysin family protein [Chakrabartyella piscis]|uniref:hemolysin family protein n=1 Tax=Chakrabartyella piscis TaxID=2918914 RepID=UPI00295857D3|nr:hemolysin family protein [Chakrabartyella piscis]
MSVNRMRLRHLVEDKVKNADKVSKLLEDPNRLLSSILVGNNLVNNAASALATTLAIGVLNGASGSAASIATIIITILILIFSEITPKTIAAQKAEKIALLVVNILAVVIVVLKPVVWALTLITGGLIRVLGCDPKGKAPLITETELKTILNVSHEEGVLETEERTMIDNIFDFGDAKAKDVMTPRTDMTAVSQDVAYDEFVGLIREHGYSRLPVYGEDVDDIVGILYVKDVLGIDPASFSAERFMREPFFTYESKPVAELLSEMQANHIVFAIVLDEYGGTAGLTTMEDIVEEVMGEIIDEYDQEEEEIEVITEDEFVVDGSTRLEDFNRMVGSSLQSDEVDTIAGYVLMVFGNFPKEADVLETDGLRIVVEEMERNRISKLRVYSNENKEMETKES